MICTHTHQQFLQMTDGLVLLQLFLRSACTCHVRFLCVLSYFVTFGDCEFGGQYQCSWLPEKIPVWNDLLCPIYTIQPVVKPVVSCIQTFNRLSNPFDKWLYHVYSRLSNTTGWTNSSIRLSNRFDKRLYHVNKHQPSNRLSNQFEDWLDVCLHNTAGCQTGCIV